MNYKWLKNDRTVSSTSNLTLSNVTLAEGGMYKCVVENVAGSEHANIEVIVQCKFIWKSFWRYTTQKLEFYVNPFVPNGFQGVENWHNGNEWVQTPRNSADLSTFAKELLKEKLILSTNFKVLIKFKVLIFGRCWVHML